MPILCVARAHARIARAIAALRSYARWAAMARATRVIRPIRFVRFWAFWGAKFPKIRYSLPWTPMNRCAKFYAGSFILVEEIRNRTNTQTKEQTNSNRHVHTLPIGMYG